MRHKKSVMRSLAMITQLGLSIMTPVFVCVFAGSYIDRHFGTNITFFLLILGFAAGGWSGYKIARTTLLLNQREDQQEDLESRREAGSLRRPEVRKPKQESRVRKKKD